MSEPTLQIVAAMGARQAVMLDAARAELVRRLGAGWQIRLDYVPFDRPPAAPILILSLDDDVGEADEHFASTALRWRDRIAGLAGTGRLLLCNLPRNEGWHRATIGSAKIRRLNRLAIDLSREWHIEIVDLDRSLALSGGGDPAVQALRAGQLLAAALIEGGGEPGGVAFPVERRLPSR